MKTLVLTLIAFMSLAAHASGRLSADYPKVQFGSIFIPVNEICVHEEHVRSIYPVAVCTEWGRGEESGCTRYIRKTLSTPIQYSKEIPSGEGSWETIEMRIPLHYKIAWGYWTEGGFQTVKTKPFSIPQCN